jgi:hypothetical protein
VVLYGCETWSLILREKHRLTVLENRVLRRIFGLKRDEMRFIYFVLFFKCNKNDQVKEDEIGRACSTNGGKRNACRTLVGKPEGNTKT